MSLFRKPYRLCVSLALVMLSVLCSAQQFKRSSRIPAAIDEAQAEQLPGNLRPSIRGARDQGAVEPDFVLPYMTLTLSGSAKQQQQLRTLLVEQQDQRSPRFHHWLSPEAFADRFGASTEEIARLSAWLQGKGFTILHVARGRDWIAFRGTALQVRNTFHVEIHRVRVHGSVHYANLEAPAVPAALRAVVVRVGGLDDIGPIASYTAVTSDSAGNPIVSHYLAPADVGAIYNFNPLYSSGIDGSGQKVVVVGQSDITPGDLQQFNAMFAVDTNLPQQVLVPGSPDPGHTSDEMEADLDLEWTGAIAPRAQIIYVSSAASAGGAFNAAQYAIDNALAPVISMSYGTCEQDLGAAAITDFEQELQKASAEGITFVAATGDRGAAGCEVASSPQFPVLQANHGPAVSYPASSPEALAVGGSTFKEGSLIVWGVDNAANGGSALSGIPETAWNDTNGTIGLAASGGGPSQCASGTGSTCAGFAKPAWQSLDILGMPNDAVRDIPDLAFAASPNHDGYLVCSVGSCANGLSGNSTVGAGGASAATSIAAGLLALLNQYAIAQGIQTNPGLGNINASLYQLSQSTNGPTILHDISGGNNVVPCAPGSTGCPTAPPFQFGYSAGKGYDLVTGLGSINANDFFTNWGWIAGNSHPTTVTTVSASNSGGAVQQVTPGSSVNFNVAVNAFTGLPGGSVELLNGTNSLGSAPLINGTATLALAPAPGAYSITAAYQGDGTFLPSLSAPITLFVGDFTVSPAMTTFSLRRGESISIPLTITPSSGDYNPTVSFGCYGLPTETTCTFSPSAVSPAGGPATTTLVIATTLPSASLSQPRIGKWTAWATGAFTAFWGIFLLGGDRRVRLQVKRIGILAGLTALLCATSCGGKTPPPNPGSYPTGTIPFSVTASSGGNNPIFHSVTLTMDLQ